MLPWHSLEMCNSPRRCNHHCTTEEKAQTHGLSNTEQNNNCTLAIADAYLLLQNLSGSIPKCRQCF